MLAFYIYSRFFLFLLFLQVLLLLFGTLMQIPVLIQVNGRFLIRVDEIVCACVCVREKKIFLVLRGAREPVIDK